MDTHPSSPNAATSDKRITPNFITDIIQADVQQGRVTRVGTRFPPEPNGYAHVGHTFACLLNYGLAQDFGGRFVLRMDDTNPETERQEYADAIQHDLNWLGVDWGKNLSYASDYFVQLHDFAVQLIQKDLAYVDSVPSDEMARSRGTVDTPGTPSPYRSRSVTENLELFDRMRAGEFPRGAHVLRAKIDLSSPNMKLRDPVLYRIVHASHYRTGDTWCIYPSYDFAQALTDALDGVTHSLCSLEFIDNNAIYKWLIEHLWSETVAPRQFEFGRRSLEYTVVSKRKLLRLVNEHHVSGWDDPRMPTISGFRRRGVTPEALRAFASGISVTRTNRTVDIAVLENAIRDDLNVRSPRVMAVLKPLRVVIENATETTLELPYWPQDVVKLSSDGLVSLPNGERVHPERATRAVPFTPEIFIEREDFEVEPPKGFKRLTLHGKVRLRGAGVIECQSFETDDAGNPTLLRCTMLPDTEKAPGVIHWVSSSQSVPFEARLYDRLFRVPQPEAEAKELEDENDPDDTTDFLSFLNPSSLEIVTGFLEPSVLHDPVDTRYQFERLGYFCRDQDSSSEKIVINRVISLRDSWAKEVIQENEMKPKEVSSVQKEKVKSPHREVPLSVQEQATHDRLIKLKVSSAEAYNLAKDKTLSNFFDATYSQYERKSSDFEPKSIYASDIAKWIVHDISKEIYESRIVPDDLLAFISYVKSSVITRATIKQILEDSSRSNKSISEVFQKYMDDQTGVLVQLNDQSFIEAIVNEVIENNPNKLTEYRAGRKGLMGFFIGQVMQVTRGQGNPQLVQEIVKRKLEP